MRGRGQHGAVMESIGWIVAGSLGETSTVELALSLYSYIDQGAVIIFPFASLLSGRGVKRGQHSSATSIAEEFALLCKEISLLLFSLRKL